MLVELSLKTQRERSFYRNAGITDAWAIIGGSMEMGETFEETVRRETMEESGLTLGKLEVFKPISGRNRIIEY